MHTKNINYTGSGEPTNVTPKYEGHAYIDIDGNRKYQSKSTTEGDYEEIALTNTPISSRIIWETLLTSDVQSVEIPGGSLGGYEYDLEIFVVNGSSTDESFVYLYVQNDETDSNYSNAYYYLYDGSSGAAHSDDANIFRVPIGMEGYAFIKLRLVGNNYRFECKSSSCVSYSVLGVNKRGIKYKVTDTNPLSKITIKSDQTDGLGIGTIIRLIDPVNKTPWSVNNRLISKFIPIAQGFDGDSPPATIETISTGNGKIKVRKFDSSSSENMLFEYDIPHGFIGDDIDVEIYGYITEATAPATNEGIAFDVSCCLAKNGDNLNKTHDSSDTVTISDLNGNSIDSQYDKFVLSSATVTQADATNGDTIFIKIERNVSHADDDYGQDIGICGIRIIHEIERDVN
ncbi:MAG: hypothetical protein BV456_06845 [Thermoplasmata archaeon M8B2D]|nr:MAG: hypothetical protein BV456_06845 [Thermoplasmata archaeon M8B2D]